MTAETRIAIDGAANLAYRITDARYAKGKKVIQPLDSREGMKGRASWLAEAVGGRWVHRSKGYTVSPAAAEKFEKLYAASFDGGLGRPVGVVSCRTEGREIALSVAQAIKIIDNVLFEHSMVPIDPGQPILQWTVLMCTKPVAFRPGGTGRLVTFKPRDKFHVTNARHGQVTSGAIVLSREGKGQAGQGWGFSPEQIAEFFVAEPGRQHA